MFSLFLNLHDCTNKEDTTNNVTQIKRELINCIEYGGRLWCNIKNKLKQNSHIAEVITLGEKIFFFEQIKLKINNNKHQISIK
jgi:hypothetical protein